MKIITASILAVIALTSPQVYAGNGDLLVKGSAGIDSTTLVSPLTVGSPIYSTANPTLVGKQVNISDQPTETTGSAVSFHSVTVPNISANSTTSYSGIMSEINTPSTSYNYGPMVGMRSRLDHYGTGTIPSQLGTYALNYNQSTGTINTQIGTYGFTVNMAGGTVNNQMGVRGFSYNYGVGTVGVQAGLYGNTINYSTGTVTTSYGLFASLSNASTGTIGTAYGLAVGNSTTAGISNPTGTITTGYGLFLGAIQATSKWAIYSSDATSPSYFAGNVGIGTTNPTFAVDVQGQVASNGVVLTSDAKFKKNLLSITSPLEKVLNLNGLTYEWKTDEYKEKNFPDGRHYGVIAQEIEKVLPEVVTTDAKGDKSVAYTEIIPVLIEAVKEQQKIIAKQQEELKEIRALISIR